MLENKRKAKQMVVSFTQDIDGEVITSSRTTNLCNYEHENVTQASLEVIEANTKQFLAADGDQKLHNFITFLGISVGKFETITRGQNNLQDMFAQQKENKTKADEENAKKFAALVSDIDFIKSDDNEQEIVVSASMEEEEKKKCKIYLKIIQEKLAH